MKRALMSSCFDSAGCPAGLEAILHTRRANDENYFEDEARQHGAYLPKILDAAVKRADANASSCPILFEADR